MFHVGFCYVGCLETPENYENRRPTKCENRPTECEIVQTASTSAFLQTMFTLNKRTTTKTKLDRKVTDNFRQNVRNVRNNL